MRYWNGAAGESEDSVDRYWMRATGEEADHRCVWCAQWTVRLMAQ